MTRGILLTLLLLLVCASAAQAAPGTVKVIPVGGTAKVLAYTGTDDANVVTFGGDATASQFTITENGIKDPPAGDDADDDCFQDGPNAVTCRDDGLGNPSARLGKGDDVSTNAGTAVWDVDGEDGKDILTGSDLAFEELDGGPDNDTLDSRGGDSGPQYYESNLYGGTGDDVLRGGPFTDYLDGAEGADDVDGGAGADDVYGGDDVDVVRGGPGDDYVDSNSGDGELVEGGDGSDSLGCGGDDREVYDGGPGVDYIGCEDTSLKGGDAVPVDFVIDLSAGVVRTVDPATSSTVRGIEDVYTSYGNDELIGTDGSNSLWSDYGNDRLDGRGGTDFVFAGRGEDRIEAADGAFDRIDGADDADTCSGDAADEIVACETLTLAPLPPPPPKPEPVVITSQDVAGPKCVIVSTKVRRAKRKIDLRAVCDENGTAIVTAAARGVTLATARATVAALSLTRIRLTVPKRHRRVLRRRGPVSVVLRTADAVGNQSLVTRSVKP